jgi:predicted nucleotidyltransferase component of viral defense system
VNSLERTMQQAQRFAPKLEILPPAQRRLWEELKHTPKDFVLYGGTALALRLAHRTSEDFDFFSNYSFAPDSLRKAIPYLHQAEMSQFEANTLTAIVDRSGPVKVSFFGGLALNRIQDPDVTLDSGIQVASLLDIAATKLATIQQRAQARDYQDIAAIMIAKITLSDALAAAAAVYGKQFNGALSLKALTNFADGDLPQLSSDTREQLRTLAAQVNLKQIPVLQARTGVTGGGIRK